MSTSSWTAYCLMGNGWEETITNVTLTHTVNDPNTGQNHIDTISALEMAAGTVSPVIVVTAFSGQDDTWNITFTSAGGTTHSAKLSANIKTEDESGIIFSQVTKENTTWQLYFPVSGDSKTDI